MKLIQNTFYKNLYSYILKIICFYFMFHQTVIASPNYLAIVIDDIGYRPQQDEAIYQLPKEVSVAIIPSAPYAYKRDKQAKLQGRDILIHLPMETLAKIKLDAGGLTLGMTQPQVNQIVTKSKQKVPNAIGLNNHMGSAATADPELMQKLMFALREHNLSFLDSRTNPKSIASKVAKNMGIKSLNRHIFLDNENTFAAVETQFKKAVKQAQKHNIAIVIGHPRKNTIAVLQQELANLPNDVQLINIGNLWQPNQISKPIKPFNILFQQKNINTYYLPEEKE